ncbi:MSEP-CTERM sorting domain-containing protein [Kordia sp.]|uniref:MSEP-CTERM sorting domain-containing protein n=1 Tax=Kordia sp. TaxID=1965332 RepID=UPI003B59A8B0
MLPFKLHKTLGYFISLIIPQLFLGWLVNDAFNTPEGNTFSFSGLAFTWGILILLFSGLILLEIKQKIQTWILPCTILVCYTILLLSLYESHLFLEIPRIKSTSINYEIIPLYLTVPGIFHAMIDVIFKYFPPKGARSENAQNFAFSVIIPLTTYLFIMVIFPFLNGAVNLSFHIEIFISKIFICVAIASFLFFFLRFVLGNIVGKSINSKNPYMLIFFGTMFPFIGLVLNANLQIFGDFNYIIVYIAFGINALGLFLLVTDAVLAKFIGFLCTSFGVPIVLYFFIIFLPYIPIAFVALLALFAGVLMLTPIILAMIQYHIMSKQFSVIAKTYGKKKVILWSLVCMTMLPMIFVGFCIDHRNYLNDLIAETDQFDASDRNYKEHDSEKITYILNEMNKSNRRLSIDTFEGRLPILSIFYDWYVFDNLQVSTQKTEEIQRLFLGEQTFPWSSYIPPQKLNAKVTYTHKTKYVADGDFYKTQVDLSITNIDSVGMREFSSNFTLPKDVFITDYYLDIEGRRTAGILAEKKAANWIYEQITTRRRDPGILQYVYGDVLSLKIFPFRKNETRTSGFTLYHRIPVHFSINDTPIDIEVEPLGESVTELSPNTFYVPSSIKEQLPKVQSPVSYYFMVDNTTKGDAFREQFQEDFSSLTKEIQQKAQVLYVDADVNWGKPTAPKASGFNYKKAIAQIQYAHRNQKSIPYVVVYAPLGNRHVGKYSSWETEKAFPYHNLIEHSHWDKKIPETIELVEFSRNEQSRFLHNNSQPSLVSFDHKATLDFDFSGSPFLNALQLRLFHDLNDLNPKRKKEHWLQGLRESFAQNILTRSTTFISLENKEQEARLLQKQKEIMDADYSEKAGKETRRMSEPYFWLLLVFAIFMLRKHFSPKQIQH